MTMLATLLIVVAVVLLLALGAGLWWQRGRSARAAPTGPRTVAELVSLRAATPAASVDRAVAPSDRNAQPTAAPAPVVAAPVEFASVGVAPAQIAPVAKERGMRTSAAAEQPLLARTAEESARAVEAPETAAVRPVPALGDDVPWRRATHMGAGLPDPVPDIPQVPALSLLRRPVRREPDPGPASSIVAAALAAPVPAPVAAPPAPVEATTTEPVEPAFPDVDPDVLFDSPPAAAEPAPAPRPPDPSPLAAEQAAADLALLRTFGPADLASRPDRAPVVALEGRGRPEPVPNPGAEQPVRFRAVRRDGTVIPDVAVALLDDRGREIGVDKADAAGVGELLAPHPGSYVLVATAPDHQPGAVTLTVGDAPVDTEVLLVGSASLAGLVRGEDGPIEGARITLVQDGEVVETADSDPDGRYLVPDLAAGEYALSVAAAGCDAHVVLVSVPDETALVHDVDLDLAGPVADHD